MTSDHDSDLTDGRRPAANAELRAGLGIGVTVGVPATIAVGALLALSHSVFDATNAALVLMIVVVAVAALGGRAAGIVTALAAVASFDFFHTKPYLSLAISSRDDIETTVLLLIVAVMVGTIASWGRSGHRRAGTARSEVRRIHRVAEIAVSGAAARTSSPWPRPSCASC
jgi:K+-sensing histidine kinase KdpD